MESGRKLWKLSPQPLASSLSWHLSGRKRPGFFLNTALCPVSTLCLLGPPRRTLRFYPPGFFLRASWLGAQRQPAAGQGVVAARWGRGAQALCTGSGRAAGPAQLSFYELQREAKFLQAPNETESKRELIGNRQEGEDLAREELGPAPGWEMCVRGRAYERLGLSTEECGLGSSSQVHTHRTQEMCVCTAGAPLALAQGCVFICSPTERVCLLIKAPHPGPGPG